MKVVIKADAIEQEGLRRRVTNGLNDYFTQICRIIDYDLSGLDTIYCSYTEEGFYSDVKALQARKGLTEGVTEEGYYRAVAKTISYDDSEKIASSIVLRDIIWDVFLGPILKMDSDGEENLPFFTYVVAHELGHCKDNYLRSEYQVIDYPSGIDYHALNRYYSSILIDEYFACYFSAKALNQDILNRMISDLWKDKENLRMEANERLAQYKLEKTDLYTIAKATSGAVWVILMQFAKIVGSIHGGCAGDVNSVLWAPTSKDTREILHAMEKLLRESISSYPKVEINSALDQLWYRLSLSFGFKFEQDENGCQVFFNDDPASIW